jgi:hypothetical protein
MKLSNQALGAIMMALQKSIMEQCDIVPVLTEFDFVDTTNGLVVENPPVLHFPDESDDNNSLKENA